MAALSSNQTEKLSAALDALGMDTLPARLIEFLRSICTFDSAVMMAYPDTAKLLVLEDQLTARDRELFEGPYRNGLYLLSPLYLQSQAGRRGFSHISDIAPKGFTDSEYYKLYYSSYGSVDQVSFLAETARGTPIVVALERVGQSEPFSLAERDALAAVEQLVAIVLRKQQWTDSATSEALQESPQPLDMHAHLQQVLAAFGSSTLTPRERDVVRLILRGYPSKSVARELDISTQTEQVHRKNIYQKLGISSHAELFTLFFDAIAQPWADGEDPLLQRRA
ncbi:MAG: LuxR C-terminal-related transcriptional regulator [Pseudomonadota bacterium]